MKPINVHYRMEGRVRVEAIHHGEKVWEWESPNLLTTEGLRRLQDTRLEAMLTYAIMGVRTNAAAITDKAYDVGASSGGAADGISYWSSTHPPDLFNWCMEMATPDQTTRTLRATSNTLATATGEFELVDNIYWKRTIIRTITYAHDCFPYSVEHKNADGLNGDVGTNRQYPLMQDEASILQELSFVEWADIFLVEPISCVPSDPIPNKKFYDHSCSAIWNRVLLPQSIGFFGPGPPFPASPANVVLDNGGEIRITYELRVYPPVDPIITMIEVDGIERTVSTRVYRFDMQSRWGNGGWLTEFGGWANMGTGGNSPPGSLGDATVMPSLTAAVSGSIAAMSREDLGSGDHYKDVRYIAATGVGNYAGGIGNFRTSRHSGTTGTDDGHGLVHIVSPPIVKLSTQRLHLDLRYSWGTI